MGGYAWYFLLCHGRVFHASLVDYLRGIGLGNLLRLLFARVAIRLVERHVALLLRGFEFDLGRCIGRRRHLFQACLLLFHESNFLLSTGLVSITNKVS